MYRVVTQFTIIDPNNESVAINCLDTTLPAIYRPPSGTAGTFLQFVEQMLDIVLYSNLKIALIDGFNIDLDSCGINRNDLLEALYSSGCETLIPLPTRGMRQSDRQFIDVCFPSHQKKITLLLL